MTAARAAPALAMIGHDCSIGPGSELVAMVGLAGGVQIGRVGAACAAPDG